MKITRIEFIDIMGDPDFFDVSNKSIIEIKQHSAQGEGDRWYYTILFDNGNEQMIFNPLRVFKIKVDE